MFTLLLVKKRLHSDNTFVVFYRQFPHTFLQLIVLTKTAKGLAGGNVCLLFAIGVCAMSHIGDIIIIGDVHINCCAI